MISEKTLAVVAKHSLVFLTFLGLGMFIFATIGWPKPAICPPSPGGAGFALGGVGLILAGVCLTFVIKFYNAPPIAARKAAALEPLSRDSADREIEGSYYAEADPNYENVVSKLAAGLYQTGVYKIENKDRGWEGVGILDGSTYYGIFKYNPKGDSGYRWGLHKVEKTFKEGGWVLEGYYADSISDSLPGPSMNMKWTKAKQ